MVSIASAIVHLDFRPSSMSCICDEAASARMLSFPIRAGASRRCIEQGKSIKKILGQNRLGFARPSVNPVISVSFPVLGEPEPLLIISGSLREKPRQYWAFRTPRLSLRVYVVFIPVFCPVIRKRPVRQAKFVPAKDGNQREEPEAYENGGGRR